MSIATVAPASYRGRLPTLVERTHPGQRNPEVVRDRMMRLLEDIQGYGESTAEYLCVVQIFSWKALRMAVLRLTPIPSLHDVLLCSGEGSVDPSMNVSLGTC
jgi:hypothetical protein